MRRRLISTACSSKGRWAWSRYEVTVLWSIIYVGHGGSFTTVVRRVLFHIRFRLYYPSLDLYHHSLGTPIRGQFLVYIRALRATLNKTDRSFNSVSLYKSASYMSFMIPAWLTHISDHDDFNALI